jgi:hypothetical protein
MIYNLFGVNHELICQFGRAPIRLCATQPPRHPPPLAWGL